ncbi:MAG TPA: Ig-like domain-containing protein [Nitrososphaera sp.]
MVKIVPKTAIGTILLSLALIAGSLLPAISLIDISYADDDDDDRGKDRDRDDRGRSKDRDRDDDDDDRGRDWWERDNDHDDDDDEDEIDFDSSDSLVITASKDTYLRKTAPDTNEGANEILRLSHIGTNRVLVAFDLSGIEDEVESATLRLYIVANENDWKEVGKVGKTTEHQTISVHTLTQDWEEGNGSNELFDWNRGNGPGATWHCAVDSEIKNNKPDCSDKWHGGEFESSADEVAITNDMEGMWIEFDVTNDVNKFITGEEPNHGWLIKKDQENLHGAIRFASSETDQGPRLVLEQSSAPSNSPPNANDDSISTNEDTQITINVLFNDSDPDGDALTAAIETTPSHGNITMTSAGSATYTPAPNYHGQDSFTYAVSDGRATDTATVAIIVDPVNDTPVADSPSVSAQEDTTITITLSATDIDGDNLTYIVVSYPSHGELGDDDGDNTITYTPEPGFVGEDSFEFKVNDGSTDSNSAIVSINITDLPNQGPIANDDSATTEGGSAVTIDVLANDSDEDGDGLHVVSTSVPSHGTVVINEDDTITYTPPRTYSGTDSFTYVVEDGQGGSDSATVTVTVTINPNNSAPNANHDFARTDEDNPITIDVLSNDSDPDGDIISIDSVTTPAYGNATIVSGSIVYTPGSGAHALREGQELTDTFQYAVSDWSKDDVATVTVTVVGLNDAPIANDGVVITDEDELVEYALPASDADAGDSLTFEIVSGPTSGTVTLDPDGSLIYSPVPNFSGADSFTYSATDSSGSSNTGTIEVTVIPVNDPPVALDDSAPTTSSGMAVTTEVLSNDFDPEGDPIEITSVSSPRFGTAEVNADGTITYTPNPGLVGQDWFTYTISDDKGATATAQVTVTMNLGVIDAVDDSATTQRNQAVKVEVLDNDIGFIEDPDIPNGDRIAIAGTPMHGMITINEDGSITYDPEPGFAGTDSFVYTIYEADFSDFDSATVTVTVVNPP